MSEGPPVFNPSTLNRPVNAQDFSNYTGSGLRDRISETKDRINWQQKQAEDFKKKCETLVRTAKSVKEPAQKVDKELVQYGDGVQDSLRNLRRNKDSIFKALSYATTGAMERVQKVRDQTNETKTQLERARKTEERLKERSKWKELTWSRFFSDFFRWFYEGIFGVIVTQPLISAEKSLEKLTEKASETKIE